MIIKNFGQFILRGRREAVMLALLFTLIPFFHWMSAVIVALITLRKGVYEGFIVLMWASLPYIVLVTLRVWMPLVDDVLFGSFLLWGLAAALRCITWSRLIELSIGLSILAVVVIHLCFPDIQTWWATQITHSVQALMGHTSIIQLNNDQMKQVIPIITPYATGTQAAIILGVAWTNLAIARYIEEASLSFPGTLSKAWLQIRLSYVITLIFAGCLLLVWRAHWGVIKDILPMMALGFLIAGISLLHACLIKAKRMIVGVLYAVIMAVALFLPMLLTVILGAAMIDSLFNIRKYVFHLSSK